MAQLPSQPARPMLMWLDFKEHMKCTLGYIFDYQQFSDCRLVVPGGEVYANRAILGMASSFFSNIFSSMPSLSAGRAADVPTVLIPDLKLSTLQSVIQFIYTGNVTLFSTEMVPFMEACNMLQLRGIECYDNVVMGICIEGSTDAGKQPARADSVLSSESAANSTFPMDDGESVHDVQPGAWNEEPPETTPLDEVLIKIEPCNELESEEQQDPFRKEDERRTQAETPIECGKNFPSYASCLSNAIVAVMNGGMTLRKAAVLHQVLQFKLAYWTNRVTRAALLTADNSSVLQSPIALATIESVLERSKREVNETLDGDDESAKATMLDKSVFSVVYDARLIAAQEQVFQQGVAISAASKRYNIAEQEIRTRLLYAHPDCSSNLKRGKWQTKPSSVNVRQKATLALYRRIYTPEQLASLKKAIRAIVVDGKLAAEMSRKYGFSRRVLYSHADKVSMQTRINHPNDPRPFEERVEAAIDELLGTNREDEPTKNRSPTNPPLQPPPLVPIVPNSSRLSKLYLGQNDHRASFSVRMKQAASAVATGRMQYPEASRAFRLNKNSIFRYVQKLNNQSSRGTVASARETTITAPEVRQENNTEDEAHTASNSDVPEIPELIPFSFDDRVAAAVKAIAERGMSYREASSRYDVPKATLWRKIGQQNSDDQN